MERVKISPLQGAMLVVTVITSTAIILLPGHMAGRDAWLATLAGTALGLAAAVIIAFLGYRFPGQTIIQYTETLLGKYFGRALSVLFLTFLVYLSALTLWDLGVFISSSLLLGTPKVAINIIGMLVAAYAARQGLEVIARVNQILLPLIIVTVFLAAVIILTMPNNTIINIFPVLEMGVKPLLAGTAAVADWMSEVFLLGMVIPYLTRPEYSRSVALGGIMVSGLVLLLVSLVVVSTFGENSAALFFPFYSAVTLIEISRVLRMDVLIISIWIIGVFIKTSFLLYILAHATAQWFGLRRHNSLTLPLAAIILSLSLIIVESMPHYMDIALQISAYLLFVPLVLLGFLLPMAVLTGRGSRP